jgi:hypothetical protein
MLFLLPMVAACQHQLNVSLNPLLPEPREWYRYHKYPLDDKDNNPLLPKPREWYRYHKYPLDDKDKLTFLCMPWGAKTIHAFLKIKTLRAQ